MGELQFQRSINTSVIHLKSQISDKMHLAFWNCFKREKSHLIYLNFLLFTGWCLFLTLPSTSKFSKKGKYDNNFMLTRIEQCSLVHRACMRKMIGFCTKMSFSFFQPSMHTLSKQCCDNVGAMIWRPPSLDVSHIVAWTFFLTLFLTCVISTVLTIAITRHFRSDNHA